MIDITKPLETNQPDTYKSVEIISSDETTVRVNLVARKGDSLSAVTFHRATGICVSQEQMDSPLRLRYQDPDATTSTTYYFITGQDSWKKEEWIRLDIKPMTDAKKAAAHAKKLGDTSREHGTNFKFMVKPQVEAKASEKWQDWITERFESGEYKKLPFHDEPWYQAKHNVLQAHFSKQLDGGVAWAKNLVKDQWTQGAPGSFLERHFGDVLTRKEIEHWATKTDGECEIKFEYDGAKIVQLYQSVGMNSCMRHKVSSFASSPHHPIEVYGAGDLACAYMIRGGQQRARTIVWPERKIWIRIYGDAGRMANALQAMGYKQGTPAHFFGAKLKKIPHRSSQFVVPYVDAGIGIDHHPDGEHLMLAVNRGVINSGSTNGVGDNLADQSIDCYQCGGRVYRRNSTLVFGLSRLVCPKCMKAQTTIKNWVMCAVSDQYAVHGSTVPVKGSDERIITNVVGDAVFEKSKNYHQMPNGDIYRVSDLVYNPQTKKYSVPEPERKQKAA